MEVEGAKRSTRPTTWMLCLASELDEQMVNHV